MKKFEVPTITIQRFDKVEVFTTSGCAESYACLDCYCSAVACDPPYTCDGLDCPTLGNYCSADTSW